MKYKESEFVELKKEFTEDLKVEIVAFLNSYLGGTIYVGVDNLGCITKLEEEERDLYQNNLYSFK